MNASGPPSPEALAALHRRCFPDGRGWSAEEFAALLVASSTLLAHQPAGFALGRVMADEAELITVAVAPEARRGGIATALIGQFEAEARSRGARQAFLEVAADNLAARALYARLGYEQTGCRRGYYRREGAAAVDALVLVRPLN